MLGKALAPRAMASAMKATVLAHPVALLRLVGIVEGISFLVLLFVAMPLKYLFDYPAAVRLVGSIHGLLFVGFGMALFRAHFERSWPMLRSAAVFGASLIPFGFLIIDRMLHDEIADEAESDAPDAAT